MLTGFRVTLLLAIVLSFVIILGIGQGFVYAPFYGTTPHAPWISPVNNAGTGGCSTVYPPTPFPSNNFSQEAKFPVLLMNASSSATLCVIYYAQPETVTPFSQSINPVVWLVQPQNESSTSSAVASSSLESGNTSSLLQAQAIGVTASRSHFVLNSYESSAVVSYTIRSNDSADGFYLLEIPLFCPSLFPLAIGYSSSQVGGDNYRQFLNSSLSSSYGCTIADQNMGESIIGVTELGIAYPSIAGPANDTYSSLNSTGGVTSRSNPSITVNYSIHLGNISALMPGSFYVNTSSPYITANETASTLYDSINSPWQFCSIELTANTDHLSPGNYTIFIGYEHNGRVYSEQQFLFQYSG